MKAILLIIGYCSILAGGRAWAEAMPYDPQGVPLSISPAEQEETKKTQTKRAAQKREEARKKAIEVLGEPEPANRAPDHESGQSEDSGTSQ